MSQPSRKRQLYLYGTLAMMAVSVIFRYATSGGGDSVVASHDTIPLAKQRLELLRRKAALVPGKLAVLKQVQGELQQREQGIVQADTAEQARAQLMQLLAKTAQANGFTAQQGSVQLPEPSPLGKDYGQVSAGESFTCGIDQLVNFLSAIANEPQILATDQIQVTPLKQKDKNINVRLTFTGVIPKKLLPVKKGDSFQ